MTMTAPSPVMNAILDELRMQPDISYADLKARLSLKGYVVLPILYGRAKLTLGLLASPASTPRLKRVEDTTLDAGMAAELPLPEAVSEDVFAAAEPQPGEVDVAPESSGRRQRGRPLGAESKFIEEVLRGNSEATYAEVSSAASDRGLTASLGSFSRTRARLGLGKRGKMAVVSEPTPRQEVRVPATKQGSVPSKQSNIAQQFSDILASVRESEEEQERLQQAVREAIAVLSAALED